MAKVAKNNILQRFKNLKCFNPLKFKPHKRDCSKLRRVSDKTLLSLRIPLTKNNREKKICNSCRWRLTKWSKNNVNKNNEGGTSTNNSPSSSEGIIQPSSSSSSAVYETKVVKNVLSPLNSPIISKTRKRQQYSNRKKKNIPEAITHTTFNIPTDDSNDSWLNDSVGSSSSSAVYETKVVKDVLSPLNRPLCLISNSPIISKTRKQQQCSNRKKKNMSEAIKRTTFNIPTDDSNDSDEEDEPTSILKNLQEKFNGTRDRTMKIKILSIVHNWSFKKITTHFPNATKHMITVAKKIASEKGILED
ncbi:uncharacterized protein LOC119687542 [Teleopsis dalmanni]|uniref:uncharacterized protein LOC119687542 n=1 Tax=Teleopsis dalmanni TaxID=139649 RepID=UPI0018CF2290|nr:uncharacterized protein LOC119687542 [Teleopsis dalmanni]